VSVELNMIFLFDKSYCIYKEHNLLNIFCLKIVDYYILNFTQTLFCSLFNLFSFFLGIIASLMTTAEVGRTPTVDPVE
jgi:hypothetical protein